MAYVQPPDVVVGDPVEAANQNQQNTALANLNSRTSGIEKLVLPNGSFEDDLDSDGEPDGWTITNEGTGATHELDSTDRADGLKSLKCTVNATTGFVSALNDTQLPVYPGARVVFGFSFQSTVATCRVRANIRWLNAGKTLITELSAFDSAINNPSSWQHFDGILVSLIAPATAAWMEFKLIAGDGTVAGVVHFDAVQPRIYHGFVPVSIIDAEQPLDSRTTAANTDYTVTPATAMSTLFAVEKPIDIVTFFTESGGGTSVDQINSVGGRRADANGGATPKLCSELKNYRVVLDKDGSFVWRSEDAGQTVEFYLVGYYV